MLQAFWAFWGIDAVISAIALYFFFVGLGDGSVSSFNMGIWTVLLAALTAVMCGSLWLKSLGRPGIGIGLLLVFAAPGLLYAAFLLLILITNPRWN